MPKGIYARTEKTKQKMRDYAMAHPEHHFVKGKASWNKDKKMSAEYCETCRQAFLGKQHSEATKEKMSIAHQGQITWNTGMKGYTNKGSFKKGQTPWIAGKHHSEKTKKELMLKWENEEYAKKTKENMAKNYKYHTNSGCFINGQLPWNKGNASLKDQIRHSLEYKQWRSDIFRRDNWTCVECEQVGGRLHAHHIKPFSELYVEFLQEYNQFSQFEDVDTLVRLAMNWKPFWIAKGITLCKDCHSKTESYLNNNIGRE